MGLSGFSLREIEGGVEKGKKGENPSGRRRRPEKINNEWNSTLFGWSELGLIIGLGTVGSTVVNHLLNHIRRNVVSSSSVLVFSLNIKHLYLRGTHFSKSLYGKHTPLIHKSLTTSST